MKKKLYNVKIHIFDVLNGETYKWVLSMYARNKKSVTKQARSLAYANFHYHYRISRIEVTEIDEGLFKYIFI